jgi:UDP-N-acetyl-D-glucosamine dehydrogenase
LDQTDSDLTLDDPSEDIIVENSSDIVISKVVDALNERSLPLKGAKVLMLGIAYKKNIGDTRESPSIVLMEKLEKRGAVVSYSDPYIPIFPKMREHHFNFSSVDITPNSLSGYDCVIIATNHDDFDYKFNLEYGKEYTDSFELTRTLREALNEETAQKEEIKKKQE